MANPKRRQQRAQRRRQLAQKKKPAEAAGDAGAGAPAPALPPILRWMAERVESNTYSPMMLFAATMQMVHMERACRQAETPEDQKQAYAQVLRGTVGSDVVKVFVQQCFQNAHPDMQAQASPDASPGASQSPDASADARSAGPGKDTPQDAGEEAYTTPDECWDTSSSCSSSSVS